MKHLVTSLFVSLFFALTAVTAHAAHYWQFKVSDPQSTSQARTFNLEFVTLSTEADDDITVDLYQNGALSGTQVTTKDFGDSGAFSVTVPTDGVYQFYMKAKSSVDGTTQTSETKNVEVKGREVRIVNAATTSTTGTTGSVRSSSSGVAGDTNGDGVVNEQDQVGQVDEGAAATEGDEADVLGEEDKADSKTSDWVWAILSALAILGAAYYWFYYRIGRVNPFSRSDNE